MFEGLHMPSGYRQPERSVGQVHSRDVYSLHNSSGIDVRAFGLCPRRAGAHALHQWPPPWGLWGWAGSATPPKPPSEPPRATLWRWMGRDTEKPATPSDGLACRSWRYAKDRRSALPISRQGGDRRGHRGTRSLVLLPSFEKGSRGDGPKGRIPVLFQRREAPKK